MNGIAATLFNYFHDLAVALLAIHWLVPSRRRVWL